MVFETGPYLKVAVFCERLLREQDGVASLIRVVDRLNVVAQGPSAPDTMPETPHQTNLVVMLVSGSAKGRQEMKVVLEEPSGLKKELMATSVLMEGGDKGQNVHVNLKATFKEEGLYWYHIYLNNVLLTKMPFTVVYSRLSTTMPGPKKQP